MRFLVITLILVAVAQAKNFQKRDDFFDIDNTKDTKNSDNTDSNYDQSIPDFNIQPKKSSDDQFSNDGDYLEEADEDFTKPVRLATAAVRKAKKPLQVDSLRTKFVAYLNLLRRLHAASPLLLHGPLTVGAQKWANNLVKAGKVAYDKATTHNQTICVVQKQQDDAIRDCSASLQARGMNYDWAHKKVNKDNKDFVIVVDRRTTHVGVGISRGPLGKVYIVAFYSPRVNEKALIEDILPYTDVFAAAKGAKCQTGYTLNEGTCYKFHKDKKNWMGAVFECAKESAVLTDVPSAGAEKAIKAASAKAVTKHIWFGLNDRINEGMYSYVAGDPVSHLNWKTGEPQGKNQNCVALELKSTLGTMADLKCTDQLNFVCRKPLEGHVLYQVEFEMPALNYQKEFSDQASDPRQKLNTQIESGFKVMAKTEKTFVKIFIIKVSDGSPKPKAAANAKPAVAPVHKVPHTSRYYSPYGPVVIGKKRDEISPTATAMPSSALPSPTVSSSDSFDDKWLDSFDDKSKGKKPVAKTPPKKTRVVAVLKFGVKNIPADPTLVLQDYLKKNKGRSAAPLGQAMKILAVKLLPPGSEPVAQTVCDTVCASTCAPTCSPNCCFQQPSYSPYQAPCGPTYNPCAPAAPAPPPAPKPKKPKTIYTVPQPRPVFHVPRWQAPPPPPKVKPVAAPPAPAPCAPTPYNSCATPAYQYGAAPSYQPAYSTYGAPPMAPPVAAPCIPTPMNPCQPPAAPVSIQGHVFGKRSIKGPGSAISCGGPPLNPCGPPMGMPMPMQPPMMPPMLPPMGAPCGAPPMNPCAPPMAPPMPPPMLPAPCGAPPMNPCAPPMAPPMQPPMLPPPAPCGPPMNPCAPPMAPLMPPPMLPPPAPCGAPMNPCAPPMAPPMPYGPMPYGPMPFGGPCTPPNPCAKKPKAGKKAKKGKKSKKGKKGKPFRRCGPPPFAPCNGYGFAPPMPMPMLPPMGAPCGAPPMNPCALPMAPPMLPPMLPPPAPCGPPMNPCAPPMAPPMPMPMPMPFAPPCAPSLFKPCPPPKAAKKPAVKKPVPVKAPSAPQPVVIAGIASPFSSGFVLPAPPPPYIAPPPMVQFTGASPCFPGNPCAKRGPILRRPKQAKSKKPVARTVQHIQPNQQSYGAWRW